MACENWLSKLFPEWKNSLCKVNALQSQTHAAFRSIAFL